MSEHPEAPAFRLGRGFTGLLWPVPSPIFPMARVDGEQGIVAGITTSIPVLSQYPE